MNWEVESTPILSRLQEQILQQTNPKINEIIARERGSEGNRASGTKSGAVSVDELECLWQYAASRTKGISICHLPNDDETSEGPGAPENLVYSTATVVLITGSVSEWWTKFLNDKNTIEGISERNLPKQEGKFSRWPAAPAARNMAKRGCNMRCFLHQSPSLF